MGLMVLKFYLSLQLSMGDVTYLKAVAAVDWMFWGNDERLLFGEVSILLLWWLNLQKKSALMLGALQRSLEM